eukprot:c23305_g2_i1 orf=373-1242(-)
MDMQEKQLCLHKNYNVWVVVWEACLDWLALVFQLVIQIIESIPALRQILEFAGVRQFCSPQSCQLAKKKRLLPPRAGGDDSKLTVILDLDETLVCAYESSGLPAVHNQALQVGVNWFQLQCIAVDKDAEGKSRVNHVTVYERPGLHEFLMKTSEFAEIVLFTAGLEGYASPLVDKIDPDHRISTRLYRPATVATRYREHVKDLSCLGRDLCRTVIVDNNPFSFVLQPLNGIPCVPFTGDNPDDQELLGVVLPLLQHLSLQQDVRPILYERFHMPAWFRKRGIPTSDWPC